MKTKLSIVCAAALVAVIGLGVSFAADSKPINSVCPVKGKAANGSKTVSYTVNFCCNNCKGKFDKQPTAFLGKVAKAPKGKCPMSGKAAGDASTTLTIAVCCGGCKGKFEKNPQAYLGKIKPEKKKN